MAVRSLAAHALSPLVAPEHLTTVLADLLNQLPTSATSTQCPERQQQQASPTCTPPTLTPPSHASAAPPEPALRDGGGGSSGSAGSRQAASRSSGSNALHGALLQLASLLSNNVVAASAAMDGGSACSEANTSACSEANISAAGVSSSGLGGSIYDAVLDLAVPRLVAAGPVCGPGGSLGCGPVELAYVRAVAALLQLLRPRQRPHAASGAGGREAAAAALVAQTERACRLAVDGCARGRISPPPATHTIASCDPATSTMPGHVPDHTPTSQLGCQEGPPLPTLGLSDFPVAMRSVMLEEAVMLWLGPALHCECLFIDTPSASATATATATATPSASAAPACATPMPLQHFVTELLARAELCLRCPSYEVRGAASKALVNTLSALSAHCSSAGGRGGAGGQAGRRIRGRVEGSAREAARDYSLHLLVSGGALQPGMLLQLQQGLAPLVWQAVEVEGTHKVGG